ncbi:RNA-directed DNA polymerase-like protein [Gossypium australe]|uniref:RNA-directed DNA polymerase-like protein n=1 Tax=Gossypium australe TaxID=47621 RepID=A0A5B6VPH7_9ROSI|nr:RNA-directed DNA polymerase-like protein [Gossypium australe]
MSRFHLSQKLEDYDLIINNHPGKANTVVDALSHKSLFSLKATNTHLTLERDSSIIVEMRARLVFYRKFRTRRKII